MAMQDTITSQVEPKQGSLRKSPKLAWNLEVT